MEIKWFYNLKEKYRTGISNIFCVFGNIGDYAVPGKLFLDYLINKLHQDLKIEDVVTFDVTSNCKIYKKDESVNCFKGSLDLIIKSLKNEEICEDDNKVVINSCSKKAVIISYPEFLIPDNQYQLNQDISNNVINLHKLINDKKFLNSDNILILLSETTAGINKMFFTSNTRTALIKVDYPCENERLQFIESLLVKDSFDKVIDNKVFAKLTSGLTRVNIEDIILSAQCNKKLSRNVIIERKKDLIQKEFGEIIQIFDVEGYSLDGFAGQETIKEYHKEILINPILSGDVSIVPKGLLYVGPPGTGKTYFAKCLAGEAGINFIEFKLSKILNKYVGESEKNLEKAFNCFESLAPVGIFIDELDQVLGRGNDDNTGVRSAIFGAFLAFLSKESNRGRIVFIGATNYPNLIDEALKRPGRFDKKIPFLCPDFTERKNVFKIHLDKTHVKYNIDDIELNELSELTKGYTQAEIENVIIKTLEVVKRKKIDVITKENVLYAIKCIIARKNNETNKMTKLALQECNDLEFIPCKYKDLINIENDNEFYKKLKELN